MYKFIYITDVHLTGSSKNIRRDDYAESLYLKMKEIIEVANSKQLDIICGGDLLDTPFVAHSYINKLLELFKTLTTKFYLNIGNHDLVGRNYNSLNQTTIGIFYRALDNFILLNKNLPVENSIIIPIGYSDNLDKERYLKFLSSNSLNIIIDHNMILTKPAIFDYIDGNSLIEMFVSRKCKVLLLTGHYHGKFEISLGDSKIINPGSVARLSRSAVDNRIPEYLIVEISGNNYSIEYQPFKSAKKFEEIMDMSNIKTETYEYLNYNFNLEVTGFNRDLLSILHDFLEKNNVKPEVRTRLLKYFSDVK